MPCCYADGKKPGFTLGRFCKNDITTNVCHVWIIVCKNLPHKKLAFFFRQPGRERREQTQVQLCRRNLYHLSTSVDDLNSIYQPLTTHFGSFRIFCSRPLPELGSFYWPTAMGGMLAKANANANVQPGGVVAKVICLKSHSQKKMWMFWTSYLFWIQSCNIQNSEEYYHSQCWWKH